MTYCKVLTELVALSLIAAILCMVIAIIERRPARGDGWRPQPSRSCLQVAEQLGRLTGQPPLASIAIEWCVQYTRESAASAMYPLMSPPSSVCSENARQLGLLTGQQGIGLIATEWCLAHARERGVLLPY